MKRLLAVIIACFCMMVTHAQTSAAPAASLERGQVIYTQYCLTCHQKNGSGVPRLNPPLAKAANVIGDKKKLIKWMLQGTPTDKQEIDGEYYSNNMPPQNFLSDKQLADVISYIRKSFGNTAGIVTPAEVKAVRATIK